MTSLYNAPEQLSKNPTNLSNLAKGIGEVSNEEKKYDIIIEENVLPGISFFKYLS